MRQFEQDSQTGNPINALALCAATPTSRLLLASRCHEYLFYCPRLRI